MQVFSIQGRICMGSLHGDGLQTETPLHISQSALGCQRSKSTGHPYLETTSSFGAVDPHADDVDCIQTHFSNLDP